MRLRTCTTIVATVASQVVGAVATAGAGSASGDRFLVSQLEFPPQLVVRGERVEVGYDAQRTPNGAEVPRATGTLYVRNHGQQTFTAVPLRLRAALAPPEGGRRLLRALVPRRFLRGRRIEYFALIRNTSGRSVAVPAAGARRPETIWVINGAHRVALSPHTFGRTRMADAIVARAEPGEVAFNSCPDSPGSCGAPFGPWTYAIGRDRSTWVFDELGPTPEETAGRLLQWAPGQPDAIARTLQLPFAARPWTRGTDFALGPRDSLYVLGGGPAAPDDRGQRLTRLAVDGRVLWTSRVGELAFNTQLRIGPDGTLYATGGAESHRDLSNWRWRWVPIASASGRPLSRSRQERGTRWSQPLPGGRSLVGVSAGWRLDPAFGGAAPHEARLAVIDRTGRVVRSWRVTCPTIIWWPMDVTPALVRGDLVFAVQASTPYSDARTATFEYLVLRLGPGGRVNTRFALPYDSPPRTPYGREAITELRIEPDGNLYQLGSAPDFGLAIYRYSLRRTAR